MNGFTSKTTGWLAVVVGFLGLVAVISLVLFFTELSQEIRSLASLGRFNDATNAAASIAGALLATTTHSTVRKLLPRLGPFLLAGAWAGAGAVTFGSWLIITGRSGVELSSYYFFYGNGLIGVWLFVLNRLARRQEAWPRSLTLLGMIAGSLMMLGLLGLMGILTGQDGNDDSPLLLVTGLSFIGIGILYPIWSLWLGRWVLSQPGRAAQPVV